MEDFRQFEVGPDLFGRNWKVLFKWLQTAITLRHSDSVDVKFILETNGTRQEKVIALMHPDLLEVSKKMGRPATDAWCSRLAALHLKHMIETAEDMEKELATVLPAQLEAYAAQLERTTVPQS